jgi:thioesterase domain-containing protein
VAKVWQEVLLAPPRGPQADFFAAGGDSLKAIRLVAGIERELGLALPLAVVSEAPAFAGLCAAVRAPHTGSSSSLVLLKPGERAPPVFFVHGAGGHVAELFAAARSMSYRGPVFGIRARGLKDPEVPHTTVEAMAAQYLHEIRQRFPGPCHLCGYSFGGLVAFEMARRLWESGEAVGLVGLFDTLPSPRIWPLSAALSLLARQAGRISVRMQEAPLRSWPAAAWRRLCAMAGSLMSRGPALPAFLRDTPVRALKVAAGSLVASARYRPGYYAGELTLFTALERDPAQPDPRRVWDGHARALRLVALPGAHLTMLSPPHAQAAAAALSKLLAAPDWASAPQETGMDRAWPRAHTVTAQGKSRS